MVPNGKKRGKNVRPADKVLLMRIIDKPEHRSIILNKNTNALTNQKKNEAWNKILEEFNLASSIRRTALQIRNIYNNELSHIRKNLAGKRSQGEISAESFDSSQSDLNLNPLLSHIQKSVTPLENIDSTEELFEHPHMKDEMNDVSNDKINESIIISPQYNDVSLSEEMENNCKSSSQPNVSSREDNADLITSTYIRPVERRSNRSLRATNSEQTKIKLFESMKRCADARYDYIIKKIELAEEKILYVRQQREKLINSNNSY